MTVRFASGWALLTETADSGCMINCDELIDVLHAEARDQIYLAILAETTPIAEMHFDLAMFSKEQAELAALLREGE